MRHMRALDVLFALVLLTAVLPSNGTATAASSDRPATAAADAMRAATPPRLAGVIVETMDAGGYTYVQLESPSGKIWAAGPQQKVTVGDAVDLPPGMPMTNFHSKKLDRTFDTIYFVSSLGPASATDTKRPAPKPPAGNQNTAGLPRPAPANDPSPAVAAGSIATPENGTTIADLYARKTELAGKTVLVRGKVVKFNSNIMNTNWLHLRDGTGDDESNDLTVTTDAQAAVGDTVLVRGTVAVNKDFGAGYRYDVLVEHATATVE